MREDEGVRREVCETMRGEKRGEWMRREGRG